MAPGGAPRERSVGRGSSPVSALRQKPQDAALTGGRAADPAPTPPSPGQDDTGAVARQLVARVSFGPYLGGKKGHYLKHSPSPQPQKPQKPPERTDDSTDRACI